MNSKLTLALAIIILILACIYLQGEINKKKAEIKEKESKSIFSINSEHLKRISIARRKTVVQFEKQNGRWIMTSPSKHLIKEWDFENNLSFVITLKKETEIKEDINLQEFRLQPPAIILTLYSDDSKEETLELGNRTYTGSAMYAKLSNSTDVFTVSTLGITDLEKSSTAFIDSGALPINMDKVKSIEIKNLKESFTIVGNNETGKWTVGDKKADLEKISKFLHTISSLETNGIKNATENIDILKKAEKFIKIKYTDFLDSGLYQIDSEGEFYICLRTPTFEILKIKKDKVDLIFGIKPEKFEERHLFNISSNDVEKIEIKTKDKNIICTKKIDEWLINNKEEPALHSLCWEIEKISWIEKLKDYPNSENIDIIFLGKEDKKINEFSILKKGEKNSDYALKIGSSIYKIEESKICQIIEIILKNSEGK